MKKMDTELIKCHSYYIMLCKAKVFILQVQDRNI